MERKNKISDKLKLNTKVRAGLIIIGIVLFAAGTAELCKSFSTKEMVLEDKEVYEYTNRFSSNYEVNIKSNPFIEGNKMPAGQTYISDLVSSLDVNLNYVYSDLSENEIPVKYNYKIDAIMKATYEANDKEYEVLNKVENLKTVQEQEATSKNLIINDSVNVVYSKYHEILKEFKQTLGMNVDANLYVILTVNTTANVNSKEVRNEYKSDYKINIGGKIATVEGKLNDSTSSSVSSKVETEKKVELDLPKLVCSSIAVIIGVVIIYFVTQRTQKLNVIGNKYKEELNRILKSCQDRIVIVENQVDTDIDNTIIVSQFEELIKLSEELYKPILCWKEKDKDETRFSVISNRVRYVYILN